jgi:hypothetical protein
MNVRVEKVRVAIHQPRIDQSRQQGQHLRGTGAPLLARAFVEP